MRRAPLAFLCFVLAGPIASLADFLTYSFAPRLARQLDTNAANDGVAYTRQPPAQKNCSYLRPAGSDPGAGTVTYGFQTSGGQLLQNVIATQSGILATAGGITGEYSTNNGATFARFFQSDPFVSDSVMTSLRANLRALNSSNLLIRYTLTTTNGDNSSVQFCRDCDDAPFSLRFDFDLPVSFLDLPRTLRVAPAPGGTVAVGDPATNVARYSQITLTAQPDPGYLFTGWFGDVVSPANPLAVILNDGKSVSPHFQALTELGGCVPANTNLVHWWPGDGDALDAVTGKTGVVAGALSYRSGKSGLSFGFDGVADALIVKALPLNPPWTLSVWVNRHDSLTGGAALTSSDAGAIKIEQAQTGRNLGLSRYGTADWYFNYSIPANHWTHVALVTVAGGTRLYVNGQLEDILPNTIPLPLTRIGAGKDSGLDQFNGSLDEIAVFSRALSLSEVSALYSAGTASICKAPRLLSASIEPAGVGINVLGPVGRKLLFSRSIDLIVWRPYWTNVNTDGRYTLLVPGARSSAFFRVAPGD